MLYLERQVKFVFGTMLNEVKMPKKGQKVYVSCPITCPEGIVIEWTDRKSPEGKRLFNVGNIRLDGSSPPLFQM
jgi:hypothetical protein